MGRPVPRTRRHRRPPRHGRDSHRRRREHPAGLPFDSLEVGAAGDRRTIRYTCNIGRFDGAEKSFLRVCGVDKAGHPSWARALLAARFNVHTGGKSDVTTDIIHDTLSCAPTLTATQITLAPTPPDVRSDERHILALEPCGLGLEPRGGGRAGGAGTESKLSRMETVDPE